MYYEEAGIEVYIRPYCGDTGYREYRAPRSSPLYTGQKNERYIEAANNERFEVFVKLDQSFDFKKCTQARASLDIDGGSIGCYDILAKSRRKALLDNSCTCDDGKWECVGFHFQELRPLEDDHLTVEQEEAEALKRGRIEVTLQLGRNKLVAGKYNPGHNYAFPEETSKKVAVDKRRSHGVAAIPVDFEVAEEDEKKYEWIPAKGDAGKEFTFTFFYASRMILELKNIIPTSTSAQDECREGERGSNDHGTYYLNEETAPLIVTTGSKSPQKPREIISLDSDDEELPPSKKIKTEVIEDIPSTRAASKSRASPTAKSSKDRERARIESRLEDIRLHREENRLHMEENKLQREEIKLKRQMLDLEDGD
ncbi:hypothetical protein KC315_g9561 [Hortaea werneckii]|nr:hypothetical protein KC315_g9561 [Hortaea werneckii]